jgi:hypothetical protein
VHAMSDRGVKLRSRHDYTNALAAILVFLWSTSKVYMRMITINLHMMGSQTGM